MHTSRAKRPALLVMAGAGFAAFGLWLWTSKAMAALWRDAPQLGLTLQSWMAANWLTFGLGQMIVACSGILPASMIAVMAGASFGMLKGTAISIVATMFGGWLAFRLSRSVLRRFIIRWTTRHAAIARLDDGMQREGWRFVMLLRVSPVMPFAATSYGLGLTRIAEKDFLVGTIAALPALVGYVALGALGRQGMMMADGRAPVAHWLVLIAGFAIVAYALRRLRRTLRALAA